MVRVLNGATVVQLAAIAIAANNLNVNVVTVYDISSIKTHRLN